LEQKAWKSFKTAPFLFYLMIIHRKMGYGEMPVTVNDIIAIMENIAPSSLAESWDSVGLQVGDGGWNVDRIRIALDPLPEVMEQACHDNINLLITHHPLLFRPLKSLNASTPVGKIIQMALENKTAVFSAHTNLDSAKGGINDFLSEKLGLQNTRVLQESKKDDTCKLVIFVPKQHQREVLTSLFASGAGQIGNYDCCSFKSTGTGTFMPRQGAKPFLGKRNELNEVDETRIETIVTQKDLPKILENVIKSHPYETPAYDVYPLLTPEFVGFGRVGDLETPMALKDFARYVKNALNLPCLKIAGDSELRVEKVAVCSGSGSGFMKSFLASKAQCYVSGDLHYHDARETQANNRGLLDIGHFASEHIMVQMLVQRLWVAVEEKNLGVSVDACGLEKDPFRII
jgi:dinuclear metal center YbgI/SA1388 family protein